MRKLVVVGSGGFGREVIDVARDLGVEVLGVTDEYVAQSNLDLLKRQGVSHLGLLAQVLPKLCAEEVEYVIGIGNGPARRRLDKLFSDAGIPAATLVHSSATLGFDVEISPGTIICAGARLTTNISLGRHVHVNLNSTIGHDTALGSYVTVNPGASISGNVSIGEASLVGSRAFIVEKISVGSDAIVGAAAAVIQPVQDGTTVVGVPARPLMRD